MTIYRKRNKVNYRKIYEIHNGPIPKDEHGRTYEIHHIDGDHNNNEPSNLMAVSIQEHYNIHYSQGEYGACRKIATKMKLSPTEMSLLVSLQNKKMVENGTHNWLGEKNPVHERIANGKQSQDMSKAQRKKVKDGTHHWLGEKNPMNKASKNGTHHFFGGEIQRRASQERVTNGTHNWLSEKHSEFSRSQALEKIKNGTHPTQRRWICEHCNKEGKGASNYVRYHGNRCSKKSL